MIPEKITTKAVELAIEHGVNALRTWFGRRRERAEGLDKAESAAIRALMQAVLETTAYQEDHESDDKRDRSGELELSRTWSEAAVAFMGIDGEIANLLFLKAQSWAGPSPWIDQRVAESGITLSEMSQLASELLIKQK